MSGVRLSQVRGISLLELLLVITIIGVLIALLLPSVQKIRETATQTDCRNRLRNLGMACHVCQDTHKLLPPHLGTFRPTGKHGNVFYHLTPFLENGAIYENSYTDPQVYGGTYPIFRCPADPSWPGTSRVAGDTYGASSYAANYQVFGVPKMDGTQSGWQGTAELPKSFEDGPSQTLLFAEKLAQCAGGGNAWARNSPDAWMPAFAALTITVYSPGPPVPIGSGSTIYTSSRFQVMPQPWTTNCSPSIASTPHRAMSVCLGDASTRVLSSGSAEAVWWALCTPRGNDVGNDGDY